MLEKYDLAFYRSKLCDFKDYRPFPPACDRKAWGKLLETSLNRERLAWVTEKAATLKPEAWKVLPAEFYMDFVRNGNRRNYEKLYFARRSELGILAIAECMEYQGRFLDSIATAIWAILEETTWCLPAHALHLENDPLPRHDVWNVDLFAAETAMVLGEIYYLLREKLEALSPSLCARLRNSIRERIIDPLLDEANPYNHWLKGTNNWTPWCASNVFGAAMYVLDDRAIAVRVAAKMTGAVRFYLESVPKDGGCDEGTLYWGVSAGTVLLFLEAFCAATSAEPDFFKDPLFAEMGRFIDQAHLAGSWFTGFADSNPRLNLRRTVVYRYGERIKSPALMNMALLAARNWNPDSHVSPLFITDCNGSAINDMLRDLFWMDYSRPVTEQKMSLTTYLPELQVVVARSRESGKGFNIAAKAGHNSERHNHNDIGQFIVYFNDDPLIVDLGRPEYTRDTFNDKRYLSWCIRGSGHNVPVINGIEQLQGSEYKATQVECETSPVVKFSMNLENAYPAEAKINMLCRQIVFNGQELTVRDSFSLDTAEAEILINMYSPALIKQLPGMIIFNNEVAMSYDPADISVEVTKIVLDDANIIASWGAQLNKITCCYKGASSGSCGFKFTEIN